MSNYSSDGYHAEDVLSDEGSNYTDPVPSPAPSPARSPLPAQPPVSPASTARRRPASASLANIRARRLHEQLERDPTSWDVQEVCAWMEHIKMGQYRKKIVHHGVDGGLLRKLTHAVLREELGIGPYGHRQIILEEIDDLFQSANSGAGDLRASRVITKPRPASAPLVRPRAPAATVHKGVLPPAGYLGPSSGKMTVYEQEARLLYEIGRKQASSRKRHAKAQQTGRNAEIADSEVKKLEGALFDLRKKNKLKFSTAQPHGTIAWHPTGDATNTRDPFPERIGKLRDIPAVEETFSPRLHKNPEYDAPSGETFVERVASDLRKRENKLRAAAAGDRMSDQELQKLADAKMSTIREFFSRRGVDLPTPRDAATRVLEGKIQSFQVDLDISDKQMKAVMKKQGAEKVIAIAGIVGSVEFMSRYRSALQNREEKAKELEARHHPGQSRSAAQDDLERLAKCMEGIGWEDADGITDDRLDSLLDRAIYFQALTKSQKETGKESSPDWKKFMADGLDNAAKEDKQKEQLLHIVQIMSCLPSEDLSRMKGRSGVSKQLAVYRGIRTQQFLYDAEMDIQARERKMRAKYEELAPKTKVLPKQRVDAFYVRLLNDAQDRRQRRESAISAKLAKQDEILRSSALFARSKRRPASAR